MSGLAVLAGLVSTVIFAASILPMVVKAIVTRDLASYSLGNLVLANGGNAVHSLYVFSLPVGPIWALHSFHVTTSALMLVWYLRFAHRPTRTGGPHVHPAPAPPDEARARSGPASPSACRSRPTHPTQPELATPSRVWRVSSR